MFTLTWPQVLAFWLQRHFLEERAEQDKLLEVVSRICGLHAQVISSAELAAWARIDKLDSGDVSAALWQERELVKVWAMRWTLHLFSKADFPLYLAAFRAFGHFRREKWLKSVGITLDDMNALLDGFRDTLTDEALTREQLADAVAQHAGRPHLREMVLGSWGTLLKPGAYQGHLVFGPSRGQNVTFVNPRHWLGDFPDLETDAARLETLRRYLSAYGPATPGDFASWWGTTRADAKKLFRALEDELIPVSVEGREAWALLTDADALQAAQPSQAVRLLPSFDPYTLGLRRDCVSALPAAYKGRVFRQQGWISAVVLAGGYVVGIWNYEAKKGRLAVTVEPFEPLSPAVRAGIEQEAARLGVYFNTEPEVNFAG
jgi:uncharacterized protein YcaQ